MLTKYLVEVNSANPKQTSSEAYTTPDKASDIIGKYIDVLETTIKGDITGDLLSQDLETALYNNYEWMKRVDNNYINYWLLQEFSPGAGISMRRVSLDGTAQYVQVSSSYGIRPVITIETSNIQ